MSEVEVLHQDDRVASDDVWHLAVPLSSRSWELTGTTAFTDDQLPADIGALNTEFDGATSWAFEQSPSGAGSHRRLLAHQRTLYWNDTVTGALSFGTVGLRALPYRREALAATANLVTSVFGTDVGTSERTEGGYADVDADGDGTPDGDVWITSGRATLDATVFYVATEHRDAFGNVTTVTYDGDALVVETLVDPAGLTTSVDIDYRTLRPATLTDPSATVTEAAFDPLGRVVGTSVRNGNEGDAAGAFSATFTYDTSALPASVHVQQRTEHGGTQWQESWVYSDGGGNVVQTKAQAAPGDASVVVSGVLSTVASDPRFIGTGRTIVNNKGYAIKQYEPFFSTTSDYEDEDELVMWGQASVFEYDPIGRNTKQTLPDGNVRMWTYGPWRVQAYDEEDNLVGGDHEGTPTTTDLDSLGRVYQSTVTPDGTAQHVTKLVLDVQGNVEQVVDPRGNTIQVQRFDPLGRPLFAGSADEGYDASASPPNGKGETRVWPAVDGQSVKTWRSGSLLLHRSYDALRRPVTLTVDEGSGSRLVQLTLYGNAIIGVPASDFAKGRPWQVYDW